MKEKYLMADDYMLTLNRVLGKIKKIIAIEKSDDTKKLIDTEDKLVHEVTLKNVDINFMRY